MQLLVTALEDYFLPMERLGCWLSVGAGCETGNERVVVTSFAEFYCSTVSGNQRRKHMIHCQYNIKMDPICIHKSLDSSNLHKHYVVLLAASGVDERIV